MARRPHDLIQVLLDEEAEFCDRDDAAIDLGQYDQPEAEAALIKVASNLDEDDDLSDSCGESLAEIWSRKHELDLEKLSTLNKVANQVAVTTLLSLRKDWAHLLALENQ